MSTQPTINLNAAEFAALVRLVNEHSDMLFGRLEGLVMVEKNSAEPSDRKAAQVRAEGLRASLRFWDGIEREVKRAQLQRANLEVRS